VSVQVSVLEKDGWVVVAVTGRIDAPAAADLEASLAGALSAEPPRLALDLAGVDYLSSPGLRVLLTSLKAVHRWGGALRLLAPKAHIRHVLAVSGLERVFEIRGTLGEP